MSQGPDTFFGMQGELQRAFDRAQHQHGVLARCQLLQFGVCSRTVSRAMELGSLVAITRGVYRVRGAPQTTAMAVMGATLASGGRVCGATAAYLWRLEVPLAVDPIHTTVGADGRQPRPSIIAVHDADRVSFRAVTHRTATFDAAPRFVDGIPTTDPARTLIDVAHLVSASDLEASFERARRLGLLSIESLQATVDRVGGRGKSGSAAIRTLLAKAAPNALESKLEVKAWRLMRSSKMPLPQRQFAVIAASGQRYRLDFAWPQLRVAFETDGFEWHSARSQWKRDHVRNAALEQCGWRIVTADWDDVVLRPRTTIERIQNALAERQLAATQCS